MNWTAISRKSLGRGVVLALIIFAYWLGTGPALLKFTAQDAEGLNTLILLLGSIYAVMYAFVIYVIWGQFTDVETFVMRECSSLDDLLRFSRYVNADLSRSIRRTVAEYSHLVIESEWRELAKRERDPATENCYTALMTIVIRGVPVTAQEQGIQERLIDIVRQAGEHRDERITKSLTRIPPTLVQLVNAISTALLMLVFVYPFHHRLVGAACLTLLAAVLVLANIVMTDLDNPVEGAYNVNSEAFSRLAV